MTGPVSQHADPDAILKPKQCPEALRTHEEDLSTTPLFVPGRSIHGVLLSAVVSLSLEPQLRTIAVEFKAPCGTSFVSEIVLVAQLETYQPGEMLG